MRPDTETPTPLPTDRYELAEYLRAVPHHDWQDIERQLRAQVGNDREALRVFEAAESDVLHENAIIGARNDLRRALDDATAGVGFALGALDELGGTAWDVEYAEGGDTDMRGFLNDAARSLRAAAALNPVRED